MREQKANTTTQLIFVFVYYGIVSFFVTTYDIRVYTYMVHFYPLFDSLSLSRSLYFFLSYDSSAHHLIDVWPSL